MLMVGATIGMRLVSMVSGIILARLLEPADFGVVALAQIILSTASLFSGLGMGLAVVQSQSDRSKIAYQGFVVSALSGSLLFLILLTNARLFSQILGNRDMVSVLQWMSAVVLLGSLTAVPEALIQKELLFGRLSTSLIVGEVVYMATAIGFAVLGAGLWSLVYAGLAKSFVYLVLIWWMSPGWDWIIPKPWDSQLMRGLLTYGIRTTGSGIVSFFNSIADSLIVGRQLGAVALGLYSKANDFTSRTVDGFNNVIGIVLFPSYAKIQNEKERLSRAYLKSLRMISIFTIPVSMGMFITAPEMVPTLLGDKWLPMVLPFQFLSAVSLVRPLSASTGALFASTGHPEYNLRAGFCITVIMVPLILLFLDKGISGVALAVLIAHTIGFGFNLYQVHSMLPGTAVKMLTVTIPALIGAGIMMLAVQISKAPLFQFGGQRHTVAPLGAMVSIGVIVYAVVMVIIQRPLVTEIVGLVLERFGLKRA